MIISGWKFLRKKGFGYWDNDAAPGQHFEGQARTLKINSLGKPQNDI